MHRHVFKIGTTGAIYGLEIRLAPTQGPTLTQGQADAHPSAHRRPRTTSSESSDHVSEHLGTPTRRRERNEACKPSRRPSGHPALGPRPGFRCLVRIAPEEVARRASGQWYGHVAPKPVSHWMFVLIGVLQAYKSFPQRAG